MLNVSPIGRNCTQEERIAFFEYDKVCKEPILSKTLVGVFNNIRCLPDPLLGNTCLRETTIMNSTCLYMHLALVKSKRVVPSSLYISN